MKKCIKCQVTITKKIRQGKKKPHITRIVLDVLIEHGFNDTFSTKQHRCSSSQKIVISLFPIFYFYIMKIMG